MLFYLYILEMTSYRNEKINGFQELEKGYRGQTGEGCGNKRLARGIPELTELLCI